MINKPIWIVSCKARPLEGVPLNLIIQSFILLKALPANSSSEAQAPLSAALSEARFELDEVISSKPYLASEWRDELQFPEIEDAAQNRLKQVTRYLRFLSRRIPLIAVN